MRRNPVSERSSNFADLIAPIKIGFIPTREESAYTCMFVHIYTYPITYSEWKISVNGAALACRVYTLVEFPVYSAKAIDEGEKKILPEPTSHERQSRKREREREIKTQRRIQSRVLKNPTVRFVSSLFRSFLYDRSINSRLYRYWKTDDLII